MSAKILFVDDEPALKSLISQRFRKKTGSEGWQLFFAHNGLEALEKLKEHPDLDMVVTDINMPGMDGLTLLSKLNHINFPLKTVVISAYDDMKNIRNAMNFGAFDFLTKPIDFQDLEITINKTLREVQQLKENQRLRQSEARAREQALDLQQGLQELKKTQAQLIQTAKMSSLGQLVAGIAHEINNPTNFIYGNISYVSDYIEDLLYLLKLYQQEYNPPTSEIQSEIATIDLQFLIADLPQILASMKGGVDRIRKIILSLRSFSRLDEANIKSVDIHEGIKSILIILQDRLQITTARPEIQVIEEYSDLPLVECYTGELNQVFINIISNAIDALNEYNKQESLDEIPAPPAITIRTVILEENSRIGIQIRDNGPGMTADVKDRIYEPFFTTKPIGQGTGLGLYISYQIIVEKHGGTLKCVSELGEGAEFWIEIPITQTRAELDLI